MESGKQPASQDGSEHQAALGAAAAPSSVTAPGPSLPFPPRPGHQLFRPSKSAVQQHGLPSVAILPLTLPCQSARFSPMAAPRCVFKVTLYHKTVLPLASPKEPEPLVSHCEFLRARSLASSPLPAVQGPCPGRTPLCFLRNPPKPSMSLQFHGSTPLDLRRTASWRKQAPPAPPADPFPFAHLDFGKGHLPHWLTFHLPCLFNPPQSGLCSQNSDCSG